MRRLLALRRLYLLPILGVFLIGCPAMTPGAGTSRGAGSLSPSHEAADVFSSSSATKESDGSSSEIGGDGGGGGGVPPDAAYADASKPYPGGPVAPGPDPTDEAYYRAIRGSVFRCLGSIPTAAQGIDKPALKTRLIGHIGLFVLKQGEGKIPPTLPLYCSNKFIRMTEVGGDGLKCTDIALTPDCEVSDDISIQGATGIAFYFFAKSGPLPSCGSVDYGNEETSPFFTLANEVDFSGLNTANPTSCDQQRARTN